MEILFEFTADVGLVIAPLLALLWLQLGLITSPFD